jgi:K+ transporter
MLLQILTIRKDLLLKVFALMLRFELKESLVAIHGLALVGLGLTKTKLLQLFFRVVFIILSNWARFVIISLHLIDLLFTLFADFDLVNWL